MLVENFPELEIHEEVPLAPFTTWRIGGKAQFYWEPRSVEAIQKVLEYCNETGIRTYFLGRGSNVLIDNAGLKGLVISTRKTLQNITFHDDYFVAQSGFPLPALSKSVASKGYSGYEFLIGIPGTVGGGVIINAGLTANKRLEIGDYVLSVKVLDKTGGLKVLKHNELSFGYRTSSLLQKNNFIVDVKFSLKEKVDSESIRQKTLLHLEDRRRKQPLTKPTAGSTFKQPNKDFSAGWYIEKSGLKGKIIGGAMVSMKHANWIENIGNATSSDVLALLELIEEEVLKVHGVSLDREIIYLK